MNLRDLLQGITAQPLSPLPIAGIACHSKQVRNGDLFIAIEGPNQDGHAYIEEAIARGAVAIVAQRMPSSLRREGITASGSLKPCPCIVVRDSREALVTVATRFYGHPSRKLRLIGVTGTNGKTTTTYLLKAILESSGVAVGLLGTVAYELGGRVVPSTNTTPGPLELQRYFAQMAGEGLPWCVMEVSSHALAQGRIAGLEFEAAIFSNLGSDHLDYHKTQEAYALAKRRLFEYLRSDGRAVINVDDEYGRLLSTTLPHHEILTYGLERLAKVSVQNLRCTWQDTEGLMTTPWGSMEVHTPLIGRHNVWNWIAASTTLLGLGLSPSAVVAGLKTVEQIPGRLERIPNDLGLNIIIDYAHTADALRLVLSSLRELTQGKLIVVFGCGGDRDQTKRQVMGRIASLMADHVILTSDNPRSEDPEEIIRQIEAGFPQGFQQFERIKDREQAIIAALSGAHPQDTVLIAGKGHEAYQMFDHVTVPFLDRQVVERYLHSRHSFAMSSQG